MKKTMLCTEDFFGLWRLVSFDYLYISGKRTAPFTDTPVGLLHYDPSGTMAVQILDPSRLVFTANNLGEGTLLENSTAFLGYLAYFGRYSLDLPNRTVTHHIQGSLFPNWIGQDVVRFFDFQNGCLILKTEPMEGGGQVFTASLVWRR